MERKKLTIKTKIIFIVPLITMLLWIAVTLHNLSTIEQSLNNSATTELRIWVSKLSELILDDFKTGGYAKIRRILKSVVESDVLSFVYLENKDGEKIFVWPEHYQQNESTNPLSISATPFDKLNFDFGSSVNYFAPINDNIGVTWGKLVFRLPNKSYVAAINDQKKKNILFGLGLLLIELALIIIVVNKMFHPLELISKSMHRLSEKLPKIELHIGELQKLVDDINESEIRTLGKQILLFIDNLLHFKEQSANLSALAAIGQSTAMVAHDVRKPLTSMKALLTVLPEIKDDPEQVKKMIANVDRSIVQTNTMLNEILDFSRDSTALELKINDPQGMITSALSDALRNHPGAIVGILYDLKHRYCMHVDGPRTIRVLTNILDNALDAMKRTESGKLFGQIRIGSYEVERDGKRFMGITIADDGPGIPENILPKIFDPFFTNGKKGGTGLGLAICHKVISMHGGKIEAGRDNNGRGTRFTIELPSSEERALINDDDLIHSSKELEVFRVEEESRVEYGDTANKAEFMRIHKERGRESYLLIVDDEPLFRETIRGMLGTLSQVKDHIKVVEADSGEMGLKIFEGRKFDYVIADIDLGHACMNGYKFAQIVMEKYPESYVLIHSNKRKEEMDVKIRKAADRVVAVSEVSNHVVIASFAAQSSEHRSVNGIATSASSGLAMTSRFMGFLPKPMKASELLQFLACKTFEAPNTLNICHPCPVCHPRENGDPKQINTLDSRLPFDHAAARTSRGAQGTRGNDIKESKKVLIINDDSDLLISFKFMLRDSNVKILEALNYEAALEHLKNSKIDVVLSDINLGDMDRNGYDLLKHVREKNQSLPFYMVSGYSRADEEPKAKELGASGYLQLPIDKNQLKEIVQ